VVGFLQDGQRSETTYNLSRGSTSC
jgi:hypothetical protein